MKTILVIEDNEENMYLINFILVKHGYDVLQALNGNSGLKLALDKKPDLIIMDWQLPDISGIEITEKLKKIKEFEDVPIVFCSSNAMKGDREKAFNAGASGYIIKPIIPENFIIDIKEYLE